MRRSLSESLSESLSASVNSMSDEQHVKRVAAYCRVSTKQELQEGSFELQMSHYRKQIESNPYMKLVDIYGDRGKSGRSISARPEFQRMLTDCEAGKIDIILTKSVSRFSRDLGECISVVRRLRKLNVSVRFEKENIDTSHEHGEMLLGIFAAIAQEESNSISQNMLWANEQHNASGKPYFKPSYGYTRERHDWVWHVDAMQAERVRMAFKLASEGVCYSSILTKLNAFEKSGSTGKQWTFRKLKYLLMNVNYTGNCLTNRYIAIQGSTRQVKINEGERVKYFIEGHHEALVSQEQFDLVQEKIRSGELHSRDMSHLLNRVR